MTQKVLVRMDRRRGRNDHMVVAIRRLDEETARTLRAHDAFWADKNPDIWLSEYNLERHHRSLVDLMQSMGEVRSVTDTDKAVRGSAAQNHDFGKLHEECHLYRLNRRLTRKEKRIIRKHPIYSAQHVRENLKRVRDDDVVTKKILRWVAVVVRWHHQPWWVFSRWLRQQTWDLCFADSYLARSENREEIGASPEQALEESISWVLREIPRPIKLLYWREIRDSIGVLRQTVNARLTQ